MNLDEIRRKFMLSSWFSPKRKPVLIPNLFSIILVICFVLGCSQASENEPPPTVVATVAPTPLPLPTFNAAVIDVVIHDSYYGDSDTNLTNPPVWSVPVNADVILNLENLGILKHNWAIVKKDAKIPVPYQEGQVGDILLYGIGMVYRDSKTTVTFTAPEAGEYIVICTVSGHYPTMQGRLVVK